MRDIKFRAWVKTSPRTPDKMIDVVGISWEHNWIESSGGRRYPLVGNTVVQYTGLHDKDGKGIYEGDIVHVIEVVGNNDAKTWDAPVIWDGNGWYLYDPNEIGCPLDGFGDGVISLSEIEVIGNIYENPELIVG